MLARVKPTEPLTLGDMAGHPAAPIVTLPENKKTPTATAREWLRNNWAALFFFTLAAGSAYRVTTGLLDANTINIIAKLLNAPPEKPVGEYLQAADGNNIAGCAVALIFFTVAACNLHNDRARRLMRALPFAVLSFSCAACAVWMIIFAKTPNYAMAPVVMFWGVGLFALTQAAFYKWNLRFLDDISREPERPPIIAKSKFAERQHSGISDTEI